MAVKIENRKLVLSERIFFEFDKDTILPVSFPILDEVARVLKVRPDIKRMRIEGHTDNYGSDAYNLDLSHRRAASVMVYLVEHGIETFRLTSAGFGFRCPLVDNDAGQPREEPPRRLHHPGAGRRAARGARSARCRHSYPRRSAPAAGSSGAASGWCTGWCPGTKPRLRERLVRSRRRPPHPNRRLPAPKPGSRCAKPATPAAKPAAPAAKPARGK